MPQLIKLRFKDTLPQVAEMDLVHRFGFHILGRNKTEHYIEFGKYRKVRPRGEVKPVKEEELSEEVTNELIRKVNRVVDRYKDPENHIRGIRARLNNLAMCCSVLPERKFIQDWANKYVVEDQ